MPDITVEVFTNGQRVGTETVTVSQEQANGDALRDTIRQAVQIFEAADRDWSTLTAAQRNDVLKLAVRSLARVGRILNNQLDAT